MCIPGQYLSHRQVHTHEPDNDEKGETDNCVHRHCPLTPSAIFTAEEPTLFTCCGSKRQFCRVVSCSPRFLRLSSLCTCAGRRKRTRSDAGDKDWPRSCGARHTVQLSDEKGHTASPQNY